MCSSGASKGPPGPPPPPGMAEPPIPSMTIKRKIVTKFRLPNLNWVALKPQQVKGTVFCELDDERLMDVIDFEQFEELFKTGNQSGVPKGPDLAVRESRKVENVTLLDAQRQRNLGEWGFLAPSALGSLWQPEVAVNYSCLFIICS